MAKYKQYLILEKSWKTFENAEEPSQKRQRLLLNLESEAQRYSIRCICLTVYQGFNFTSSF
jgi:hypothetical protein